MDSLDVLQASILDLDYQLRNEDVPLTIGGGFGLYLRQGHLNQLTERTLFDRLPHQRSTNDIDPI